MIQGNLPYKKKRSYDLMKLKDFFTLDALVTGWEHGDKTGKYKHHMGKLLCVDIKTGRDFKVGSGFVDSDRDTTDGWIGKVIEVKYQNFTDEGKPRFPVYIRTREDIDSSSLVIPAASTTEKE
jgi:DNA ligase-1